MNVCKKISMIVGLGLIFSMGVAHARVTGVTEFNDLIPKHPGKDYATVLAATVSTLDNVVVYIGAGTCATMEAIKKLCKEYSDVVFVKINSDVFSSFAVGQTPQLQFYKYGVVCKVTGAKTIAQLTVLLKHFYR
jgi:hypothetical protein